MKYLLEIAKVVTKRKVKKIEIFDDHSLRQRQSKFVQFFEGVTSGKFESDEDAARRLYETTPKDSRYRQLKSRFRRRMLNTLFFIDVNKSKSADYEQAYANAHKDWAMVKILQINHADNTAAQLARSVLTTARKFQFTDLIINCSRILRGYAAAEGDEKAFQEYDQHIRTHASILEAEMRSEELFQRVTIHYAAPLTADSELQQAISDYSNTLANLSERFESPVIFYNLYLVWIMRFELSRSFDTVLEICDRAEQQIADRPEYYIEDKLVMLYTKRMSAYLHKQDFRRGRSNAEQCLSKFPEGSDPWFRFMEYYLLLAIHSEHYIQALAIFNRALTDPAYKKLDRDEQEKWFIYEAYINYLFERQDDLSIELPKPKRSRYRERSFLQQEHRYSKRLRNFEVLCKVLQVMHWLDRSAHKEAAVVIEDLRALAARKLNREVYPRAIRVIKLLAALKKSDFQQPEPQRIEKHLRALKERPFLYRGAVAELELIPYEKLWAMIASRLP